MLLINFSNIFFTNFNFIQINSPLTFIEMHNVTIQKSHFQNCSFLFLSDVEITNNGWIIKFSIFNQSNSKAISLQGIFLNAHNSKIIFSNFSIENNQIYNGPFCFLIFSYYNVSLINFIIKNNSAASLNPISVIDKNYLFIFTILECKFLKISNLLFQNNDLKHYNNFNLQSIEVILFNNFAVLNVFVNQFFYFQDVIYLFFNNMIFNEIYNQNPYTIYSSFFWIKRFAYILLINSSFSHINATNFATILYFHSKNNAMISLESCFFSITLWKITIQKLFMLLWFFSIY